MGKKYIIEVNNVPYIRGAEKLYECANIGGVVLEEDELKKLEEISLEHAIKILRDEKWLEAHDKEISEGVWRKANIKDNNNAISWERFLKAPSIFQVENEVKMGVKCPECGEFIYRDNTVICTSNPPKSKYFCKKCRWVGYA